MAEKRTPMAWQHRDINYHQNGYHPGGPAATNSSYGGHGGIEVESRGPPSTSDRISHRTDKSWRTQRDSSAGGYGGQGSSTGHGKYDPSQGPGPYLVPRVPYYGNERPPSRLQSRGTAATASSTTTSTSDDESERHTRRDADPGGSQPPMRQPPHPHSIYGQVPPAGYIPNAYNGSMKPAHSVPALAVGTYDGEPCPVHGMGPPMPGYGMHPGMIDPQIAYTQQSGMPMHPSMYRKAASIYDVRLLTPPPPPMPIYGTLPSKPGMIPGDRRSFVGFPGVGPPANIPPHFLPPMSRPQPLVLSEDGITEPLPVRSNKNAFDLPQKLLPNGLEVERWKGCSKGAVCVTWIILSVICTGIILGLLLMFIL